jgi:DNA-binding response OmpR family regulator
MQTSGSVLVSKPLIAVVNDDSAFLNLMYQLLTDEGYNCFIHVVGSTAYEKIREASPDLVVLDIRMSDPEAGWHVLDMMRLDPVTSEIPVIVCSADSQQIREKSERLEQQNASAIEKPFDLEELLGMVEGVLGKTHSEVSQQSD